MTNPAPSEELDFKKLSPAELPELKELSRSTFFDAFASQNNPEDLHSYLDKAFSEDSLKNELFEPRSEFYFAKIKGKTVGYFKINFETAQTDFQEDDGMELERIYVIKEHQNQKIGQAMLDAVIEMAIQRKMRYLWLGVWEKNEKAIKFYEKNRFKFAGEHEFWVGNDRQTDRIMKLELQ
ncbi:MAG: GNAT family N-acetyltransferase [Salinimicrobium sp.]